MIIRCIQTSIPDTDSFVINHDMREYLDLGKSYEVYGIRIAEEATYYVIFDDNHLLEVPSSLFEIIDPKVSPLWLVHHGPKNEVRLWPDIFYQDDFFENFSDSQEKERGAFEELRQLFSAYNKILR